MLVELLKPGGAELARRWLAALLIVDEADRPTMVAAVEAQIVEEYGIARDYDAPTPAGRRNAETSAEEIVVVHPPVQREGYVERVETTYAMPARGASKPKADRALKRKAH